MRHRRRAIGFYTRGKGRRRKVYPLTEASGARFSSGVSATNISPTILRNRNEWPDFTDEVWGWYWDDRVNRWEPIYGKSTERREYDTGTGYSSFGRCVIQGSCVSEQTRKPSIET